MSLIDQPYRRTTLRNPRWVMNH